MIPMFIVSRNRPLFLASYLESLQGQAVDPRVFFRADEKFAGAYQEIAAKHQWCTFACDDGSIRMTQAIRMWADENGPYGILSVDDNLCVGCIDEWAIRGLLELDKVFGVSLRLQNGIRGKVHEVGPGGVIMWNPSEWPPRHSWGYPWEFSSTVYRMSTIARVS